MFGVALTMALQLTAANWESKSYETAYQEMQQSGRALLVLVGADWCPGCRTMKQSVLPNMDRGGQLGQVSLAVVNTDHEPGLAGKLMRGGTIPQLVLFTKTDAGWQRTQLTGAHREGQVRTFIERAMETHVSAPNAICSEP